MFSLIHRTLPTIKSFHHLHRFILRGNLNPEILKPFLSAADKVQNGSLEKHITKSDNPKFINYVLFTKYDNEMSTLYLFKNVAWDFKQRFSSTEFFWLNIFEPTSSQAIVPNRAKSLNFRAPTYFCHNAEYLFRLHANFLRLQLNFLKISPMIHTKLVLKDLTMFQHMLSRNFSFLVCFPFHSLHHKTFYYLRFKNLLVITK